MKPANSRTELSNVKSLSAIESTAAVVFNLTGSVNVSPALTVAPPTVKLAVFGTGLAFTVTVHSAFLPFDAVAVIFAVPAAIAVTLPS